MSEVQGFVGVRRRVLNHHKGMYYLVIYHLVIVTVVSVGVDGLELLYPEGIGDREVQESLNGIKLSYDLAIYHLFI